MKVLVAHVANGGTITTLCETWGVSYSSVLAWVYADRTREREYVRALNDRAEWAKESLLAELRNVALLDIRRIFNGEGVLLPVHMWPKEVAAALSSFEVLEQIEDDIKIGALKKFKFFDKLRAIELLGKNLILFVERHELSGRVTLEQLVSGIGAEVTNGGQDGKEKETA